MSGRARRTLVVDGLFSFLSFCRLTSLVSLLKYSQMRVKRLEIQGFKSFKDKTVIHFDHSITGIVGPNGSGKSNIVDAFFWVMGEQSYKHMRGTGSDDLIFNGSSKYSPLGMAEATLVMETDVIDPTTAAAGASAADVMIAVRTKEISVTRRLYRSGEGEYFVNGTPARLKDIHELFMDTGVGAKGYSVIEQGQIGKIVNSKPEERRLLIEEAAGIAKYKARKKESLRKMEATQANLARLTDIIQEIEKTLNSLERQAQKARQYRKYKDELFDKEITWGRRKSQIFRRNLEALRKQKETLEQDLAGLRAGLQTAENSLEVDRIHLLTESKEAEIYQAQVQTLAEELTHQRSSLDLSRRRQGDLASQLEMLETERSELEVSVSSDTQRLSEQETQAEEADALYAHASEEAQQMNEVLDELRREAQLARSHLDSTQRQLMAGMNQISDLTSKAAALLSKAESARVQAERLTQQAEAQREKLEHLQNELQEAKTESESVRSQRDQLQTERKEQSAQLQSEDQKLRTLEKDRDYSLRNVTQLRSKLLSLQELDESNEGLADGPKSALEWARNQGKEDQISALTDSMDVSDGYENVLGCWLEKRIESLLIEDPELALPLIEKIRNGKQGRVNLQWLPSESQRKQAPADSESFSKISALLESLGFKVKGPLSQFARSVSEAPNLLSHMVSQVCVVESSEPLTTFIQNDGFSQLQGWAVVSMDGVALEPDGLIRGGSLDNSGAVGVLKRKRSIEDLKTQVTEAEGQHQALEDQVTALKQSLELLRARQQALQAELQGLEIQSAALDRDIHQTDRAYQEAKRHLESLESDIEETQQEAENAQEDRQTVQLQLEELISTRAESEELISASKNALTDKEDQLHEKERELQSVRVREASLRERAVSLRREREATKSLIQDREKRLNEIRRTLDRASREQAEFSGGEIDLQQKIEDLTLRLGQSKEQLALIKDRIEQINATVNSNLEQSKKSHKQADLKTTEANQIALDIEKLSGDLSHLVLNLEEKYGPNCLTPQQMVIQTQAPTFALALEGSEEGIAVEGGGADLAVAAPIESAGVIEETVEIPLTELSPEEEIALGEEVERLRERIRRLGEVNVMAIEEFETLKKRYDHLLTEKTDLERSLENLQDAIEHINKTSEERFKKAFEAIAERFERLFPIIFGGGQAKLSLVYPEGSNDILEAGVDILAQPPGKKVSNITLLSGGEKALTAVSLIFAIFMVKPSPFCVLDEVDAPLDDANIGKFNALLREMSSKSQFILITHNKKTMELNDTLYGVTMEEPGVSKMVSIEMH